MTPCTLQYAALAVKLVGTALTVAIFVPFTEDTFSGADLPALIGWAYVIWFGLLLPGAVAVALWVQRWWLRLPALALSAWALLTVHGDYANRADDPLTGLNFIAVGICLLLALLLDLWRGELQRSQVDAY